MFILVQRMCNRATSQRCEMEMYTMKLKGFAIVATATALLCSSSIALAACPTKGVKELTGAGATFPYPLYSKMFAEYDKLCHVQVNYQSIGSGGGIRQLQEQTV